MPVSIMILRAQDVTQPFWASFLNNDCSETVPIKDRCDPMRVHLCAFWEAVSPSTQARLIFCVAKQLKEMEKHYITGSHCNLLTTHTQKKLPSDLQMLTVSIMLSEQSPQYYELLMLRNFGPSHLKYPRI